MLQGQLLLGQNLQEHLEVTDCHRLPQDVLAMAKQFEDQGTQNQRTCSDFKWLNDTMQYTVLYIYIIYVVYTVYNIYIYIIFICFVCAYYTESAVALLCSGA